MSSSLPQIATNSQSLNGIISLSDGVITIEDGIITGLDEIDLVKIDVEGATYEVLESFGSDINKLKFIHLEAEYVQFWQNQKLYSDVSNLLLGYGFKEAYKN